MGHSISTGSLTKIEIGAEYSMIAYTKLEEVHECEYYAELAAAIIAA